MSRPLVATHFSIVTTLSRTKVIAEHLALTYGMERICRRVRAIDIAVLDLHDPASKAADLLLAECRRALDEDGSGAIVPRLRGDGRSLGRPVPSASARR